MARRLRFIGTTSEDGNCPTLYEDLDTGEILVQYALHPAGVPPSPARAAHSLSTAWRSVSGAVTRIE
jgi:hypothetical protein